MCHARPSQRWISPTLPPTRGRYPTSNASVGERGSTPVTEAPAHAGLVTRAQPTPRRWITQGRPKLRVMPVIQTPPAGDADTVFR